MLRTDVSRVSGASLSYGCKASSYRFEPASADQMRQYIKLVETTYEPLGFLNDHAEAFMPRQDTGCFVLVHEGEVVGSCSLTPISEGGSVFHDLIPGAGQIADVKMIELNNIILVPHLRGGIGLAIILYHAALRALEMDADFVVGITRYQTLRYFVEAGAIPVDHEPLHLLGREDLHDFVIYYDIRNCDARTYLKERARRLFDQVGTLKNIRGRVKQASRRTREAVPADA